MLNLGRHIAVIVICLAVAPAEAQTLPNTRRTFVDVTTARLDVEFRIAPRVSVVPRLRVTAFPSLLDDSGLAPRMLMARPEIAVRWAF